MSKCRDKNRSSAQTLEPTSPSTCMEGLKGIASAHFADLNFALSEVSKEDQNSVTQLVNKVDKVSFKVELVRTPEMEQKL
ncbi:unnamed protein product [Moneuplotes crassus]|uniref:Uncharacterized protein n=1 Tax=Euplotes crassus TaxID=5936 RepID=A0AAD1XN85_EUPCR|nr:unnamed protein product [Moneuplotes crassus]